MKVSFISILLVAVSSADTCRVLVEGAGCRTRQLAMQRIWEELTRVQSVEILPRERAPAANHRYFIVKSEGKSPTQDDFIKSLGRRAKHYIVQSVEPVPAAE